MVVRLLRGSPRPILSGTPGASGKSVETTKKKELYLRARQWTGLHVIELEPNDVGDGESKFSRRAHRP